MTVKVVRRIRASQRTRVVGESLSRSYLVIFLNMPDWNLLYFRLANIHVVCAICSLQTFCLRATWPICLSVACLVRSARFFSDMKVQIGVKTWTQK